MTDKPASTAPLAVGLPLVQGRCPACGTKGLFLGDGGYITCSLIDCPQPDAATEVIADFWDARQHDAFTFCAQLVGHVSMTEFAKKITEKVTAVAQRKEAVEYANEQKQQAEEAEAVLGLLRTRVQSAADEARGSMRDWLIDALADAADPREPSTAQTFREQAARAEAANTRVRTLAGRIRQGAPWTANDDDIAAHILRALDGDQAPAASCSPDVAETEPNNSRTTMDNPAAWTPPPPGDRREQLPDHLLALIDIPSYTSTACEAADLLAWQMPKYKHRRAELGDHADRLHARCRLQNKFTGQPCVCRCHQQTDPPVHIGGQANAEHCPACKGTNPGYPFICPGPNAAEADPELTAEEARDLADKLGTQLYRAQDALAFVEECCVIVDREGRQPTTAMVREWLKGARCGRQLAADPSDTPATTMARWLLEGARDLDIPAGDEASLTGVWMPDPPIGCLTVTAEPTPSQRPDLHAQLADAIRTAACDGDCGRTETECARQRIQPIVWHHGRLAEVSGSPEMFADAVVPLLCREWPWLRAVAEDAAPPSGS